MKIILDITKVDDYALRFIPKIIIGKLINNKFYKHLEKYDDYLKNNFKINMSAKNIVYNALKTMKVYREKDRYIYEIRDDLLLGEYKVKDLVKFIEYGNLEIKGSDVLSKIKHYIENNDKYWYNIYLMREGKLVV